MWKKRGNVYEGFKEDISQKILNEVYKYVPKAEKSLDYYELSTPLSVKNLANYSRITLFSILDL